ncbi:MAG TPA: hypothetical protein VIT43_05360 [Candidatus Dormibacteraeota bacterium]
MQRDRVRWSGSWLRSGTSWEKGDRVTEPIALSKQAKDLGGRCAEGAVAGAVTRKWGCGEVRRLIWEPFLARNRPRSFARATPSTNALSVQQISNRRDGPNGVKGSLVIPAADAGIEDCVRQREEELDIRLDAGFARSMVISVSNELCEQVPVPRRELGVRSIGPVFGDHLVVVGEPGA